MPTPTITGTRLAGSSDLPLLVCGPSLGTSAGALWSTTATLLGGEFDVVGWDLPGHGDNREPLAGDFDMSELADGVLAYVDGVQGEQGRSGEPFLYAGDSVGGAVGQQLLLDHPGRLRAAVLACTSPRFGDEASWRERAALVLDSGTSVMVEGSIQRWFGPGFVDREPVIADALLQSLRSADRAGYAAVCGALSTFDVRADLHRIEPPVVALAGAHDVAAPVAAMTALAQGVRHGSLVVLERVGHLAPAEAPRETAQVIRDAVPG